MLTLTAMLTAIFVSCAIGPTRATAEYDATNLSDDAPITEAPAFFGPNHEPIHIMDLPPGTTLSSGYSPNGPLDIEGDQAFIVTTIPRANVWALLVYLWPEFVLVLVVLILPPVAWRFRRATKRPQVTGEPYCRKCNYRLTGSTAKDCPECGLTLSDRNRIVGKYRSVKRSAIAMVLLLSVGGFVGYKWYPPSNEIGYGFMSELPREGAVSNWFNWPSHAAHEWVNEELIDTAWTDHLSNNYGQLWRVDLRTGNFVGCMHEYARGESPDDVPPNLRFEIDEIASPSINRVGNLRILRTGTERHLFDSKRGIYATLPHGEWDAGYNGSPEGLRWSPDGRYLFDAVTYNVPVIWDTTTWKKLATCPDTIHDDKFTPDIVSIRTVRAIPDGLTTVVEATTDHLSPRLRRIFLWNGQTDAIRELPETVLDHEVYFFAITDDERYIIAEQFSAGPYPLIWDTKRIADGDDETLDVPWTKFGVNPAGWTAFIAAIARKGHIVYIFRDTFFAWHLDTGDVKPMSQPPSDAEVHWIRKPPIPYGPPSVNVNGLKIEIYVPAEEEIETIRTPVEVNPIGMGALYGTLSMSGPSNRLIYGSVGDTIVIYDSKAKKWLGRFNLPTGALALYPPVHINDEGTFLVVLVPDKTDTVKLHVFALPALE